MPALPESVQRHLGECTAPVLLLAVVIVATVPIGLWGMPGFRYGPFLLTLSAILLAHGIGHYAASRYFEIKDTERGYLSGSRASQVAVGAAGPIAGFIVSVATACYGLFHSTFFGPRSASPPVQFSVPGVVELLRITLMPSYPDIPPTLQMIPHPSLLAACMGVLITALTLLPAARLDGGQIIYALSPRLHRITSTVTVAGLIYLGTVEWFGWFFCAWVLMFSSMQQPKQIGRKSLGLEWLLLPPICLAIFLLSTTTQPVVGASLTQALLKLR